MEWLDKFIAKRLHEDSSKKQQTNKVRVVPGWKTDLASLIDEQKNQFRNKHKTEVHTSSKVVNKMPEFKEKELKPALQQNYIEGHITSKNEAEIDKNVRALDKLRAMPTNPSNKGSRISAIFELLGEQEAFETMRRLRWPTGVVCPRCSSTNIKRKNVQHKNDATKEFHYFYECINCKNRGEPSIFDDLTGMPKDLGYYEIRKIMMCWYLLTCCSISQISREIGLPVHQVTQILAYLHNEVSYAEQRNVMQAELEENAPVKKKAPDISANAQAEETSSELDFHSRLRERNREIVRQPERFK